MLIIYESLLLLPGQDLGAIEHFQFLYQESWDDCLRELCER
jgi:hypothetical protein